MPQSMVFDALVQSWNGELASEYMHYQSCFEEFSTTVHCCRYSRLWLICKLCHLAILGFTFLYVVQWGIHISRHCTGLNGFAMFFIPPAAPSAPPEVREVKETGAHWAMVAWGIPPEAGRNGIIISYIVQLLDTHGAVVRNETVAVQDPTFDSPQSLAHNFTSLKPYTRYMWRVAATTTAGAGPFTSIDDVAHFRTMQSCELLGVWHCATPLFATAPAAQLIAYPHML